MNSLAPDNRPRDWSYRVAFDKKDLPSLQEMVKHIRETHDVDMIERFNANCDRFLSGQNSNLDLDLELDLDLNPEFPTPTEITKTEDLVVNEGLAQSINIILGTSTDRWTLIRLAVGNNGIPPRVTDTNLDNGGGGPFSLVLATYGWSEAKGMKLFFGTVGPQNTSSTDGPLSTNIIGDMGIFSNSGSFMLNRESFYNNRVSRTFAPDLGVYTSVFLFSCVIEFCPVA